MAMKKKNVKRAETMIPESLTTPEFTAAWEEWLRFTVDRGMPLTDYDAARQLKLLAKLGTEKAIADIRKTMDEHPLERAKKGNGAKAETTTSTDESTSSAEDTAKTTNGKKAKNSKESKAKKMSALDAAAKVLEEKSEAMNCQEMIDAMKSSKYWISSNGLTPQATLYSAITREIKTKGAKARFKKTDRGQFALR